MTTREAIVAIMAAVESLGCVLCDDQFNFESAPSSVMNKAYRVEVGTVSIDEISGSQVQKNKTISLWIANKMTAKGDRKEYFLDYLDEVEAVEDELMDVFTSIPSLVTESSMSKYLENYVVFNITFQLSYWRNI